jgi:ketosteroid isomerase-like protein
MSRTIALLALCALLLSVAACSRSADEGAGREVPPTRADLEAVEELVRRWDQGLNAKNVDALLRLYAAEPTAMPPDEPAVTGKEAIRGWLKRFFSRGAVEARNHIKLGRVSGDWAFTRGTFRLTVTSGADDAQVEETGTWAALMNKQPDGSWKVTRNIWNSDLPPPGETPHVFESEGSDAGLPANGQEKACAQEPGGLDESFARLLEAGDVPGLVALHTESAVRMPPGMVTVEGRDAIRSFFRTFVEAFKPRQITLSGAGEQISGDWAAQWSGYEIGGTPVAGGPPVTERGKLLSVSSRQADGCWLYEWVIWNRDNPVPDNGG